MDVNKYEKLVVDEQLGSTDVEPDPALRKGRCRPETILLEMAEKMRRVELLQKYRKRRRTRRGRKILSVHYQK